MRIRYEHKIAGVTDRSCSSGDRISPAFGLGLESGAHRSSYLSHIALGESQYARDGFTLFVAFLQALGIDLVQVVFTRCELGLWVAGFIPLEAVDNSLKVHVHLCFDTSSPALERAARRGIGHVEGVEGEYVALVLWFLVWKIG